MVISSQASFVGSLSSWLDIDPKSDFSLQNFPYGVFSMLSSSSDNDKPPRCASAIGSYVIDLHELAKENIFDEYLPDAREVFASSSLNAFMSKPRPIWKKVRQSLINLFLLGGTDLRLSSNLELQKRVLVPMDSDKVIMHLPAIIGDYTDFYSSKEHATNVGTMFRGKENALNPNWLSLPVGYHGRSSSVFVSGTDIVRPCGQILTSSPKDPPVVSLQPSQKLDFELEMAFFVGGQPNIPGSSISMGNANDHIFGFTLMNDWSARDIQKWEYVPLGPFGSKNFATTISPWVVTMDALEPFVCATSFKVQDPPPLDYLMDPNYSSFDIQLEVQIQTENMKVPATVCRSNYANMYWNARQQLVHHSITGCMMRAGDLLGSGTISGSTPDSYGSMLELCWNGTKDVVLGISGETRKFLVDGDTVIIKGFCNHVSDDGSPFRVGFGECRGKIYPSRSTLSEGAARGGWVANQNL